MKENKKDISPSGHSLENKSSAFMAAQLVGITCILSRDQQKY